MKNRKLKKEQVEKLQNFCDEYKQKTGFGYKILTGVAIGLASISLVGCTDDSKAYKVDYDSTTNINNEYANEEVRLEDDLRAFLCNKTGLDINLINIKDVKLVQDNGCYLILTGEMVTDVKYGLQDCSVSLKISYKQAQLAEKFLQNDTKYYKWAGRFEIYSTNEDVAALKYDDSFLNGMHNIIYDKDTQIVSVYNDESKEILYNNDLSM